MYDYECRQLQVTYRWSYRDFLNVCATKLLYILTIFYTPVCQFIYLVYCLFIHLHVACVRAHFIYLQNLKKLKTSQAAFCFDSPSVWNKICLSWWILRSRSISRRLKTELFSLVTTSCSASCRVSQSLLWFISNCQLSHVK